MSQHSITVTRGNPSEEEAAAIAAAIDLFASEMSTPAGVEADSQSNWQRAALREAVEARRITANVWGAAPVGPF